MNNSFRCFNGSPEVIRLVVMMYVRHPLSRRNVEDFLVELRGLEPRCSQRCEPLSDVSISRRFQGRGDAIGGGPEWGGLLTPR